MACSRCRKVIGHLYISIIIHLCESIFYNYLQMHLMRMKLSSSLLKASPQVLLGLTCFEKVSFIIFTGKGVDFAQENMNLMINNFINVSKLHIISLERRKIVLSGGIHYILLRFCQLFEILNQTCVAFLSETSCS